MNESRKQFEEWMTDMGKHPLAIEKVDGNYILASARTQWEAWNASRAAIEKGSIVGYQDPYGNAVSAGDFDGGEDEMHETAYQEGWTPLVLAAGIKVKE
ncbi:hypothetical protein K9J15_03600 [Enterobacter cloacae]|uniref:hypothetical protein n=1 Tax=Enterobacter cloacae TaxID=550 RepID=UPI0022CDD5BF|nr:hypothetical protein [Enterobacter cloacae]MCZ9578928.1 hypothetical protein [Enterobacter cloacae]HAS1222720.1 hypothetical protein [Enterobacter cloacae]